MLDDVLRMIFIVREPTFLILCDDKCIISRKRFLVSWQKSHSFPVGQNN